MLPKKDSSDAAVESKACESGPVPKRRRHVGESGLPRLYDDEETTDIRAGARLVPEAVRSAPKPRLTMLTGERGGEVISLDGKSAFTIGRSQLAQLRLDDPGISRIHCVVHQSGKQVWIEDQGSGNGTYVNGARVSAAVLVPGDRVQLGATVVLQFGTFDETEDTLARRLYLASTRDALTHVYNRAYLGERVVSEIAHSRRHGLSLAVLLVDIDFFKRVNDTFGHQAGDNVLREVANALNGSVRIDDTLARYGGEEFAVVLRDSNAGVATLMAERLRQRVMALRIVSGDTVIGVTISVGIATISECDDTTDVPSALFALADERLYAAKAAGRNRVCAS